MDAAVSELERDARPWARLGLGALVLFVAAVLGVRMLGTAGEDGAGPATTPTTGPVTPVSDGQSGGPAAAVEPTTTPPPSDDPAAAAAAGAVPSDRPGSGLSSARGVRLYAVDGPELVALDVATGLVQRSPIDFGGQPDGRRHVFASQGKVLVWPVGETDDLVGVSVRSGRTGTSEVLVPSVDEAQPGWSLGNVVVRTGDGLAEVAGDGAFRWGPRQPPRSVGGVLLGALNQRAVLGDGAVRSWGPIDLDEPGPSLVPPDGRLVALGADGPIWLAADGRLHLPGFDGDVVVDLAPGPRSPGIAGASVAPNGALAMTVVGPDGRSEVALVDRSGGVELVAVAGGRSGAAALSVVRWSPDSRWVVVADPALQTLAVIRAGTGEVFDLAPLPVEAPADFAVVRVSGG